MCLNFTKVSSSASLSGLDTDGGALRRPPAVFIRSHWNLDHEMVQCIMFWGYSTPNFDELLYFLRFFRLDFGMGGTGVTWRFRIAKSIQFQYPRGQPWWQSWNSSNNIRFWIGKGNLIWKPRWPPWHSVTYYDQPNPGERFLAHLISHGSSFKVAQVVPLCWTRWLRELRTEKCLNVCFLYKAKQIWE